MTMKAILRLTGKVRFSRSFRSIRLRRSAASAACLLLHGPLGARSWRHEGRAPAPISIRLNDGAERQFRGLYNAFAWSQTNGHANGQLYSALAALEKWLCGLVDRGADVSGHIDTLMRHADSVAILGVLINVGKRFPELFSTVLKPLLTVASFYAWDEGRVRNSEYSFDGMTWVRSGEMVFEMARDWHAAPYRQKTLIAILSELCRKDHALGDFVNAAAAQWTPPDGDKERIEFQIRARAARLPQLPRHRGREQKSRRNLYALPSLPLRSPDFTREALGAGGPCFPAKLPPLSCCA